MAASCRNIIRTSFCM